MFNIASTHTLQIIERFQLEGTSGHQVQPPAQINAYKASCTYINIYLNKNTLVQVLSYV